MLYIVAYPYWESNPDDKLRRLACYPLHHRGKMVATGIEPVKLNAEVLKTSPVSNWVNYQKYLYIFLLEFYNLFMVLVGLEPTTSAL